MFSRVDSIAIFNPWLKPLTKNVSNVVVELLIEMLRLGDVTTKKSGVDEVTNKEEAPVIEQLRK